MIEPRYCIVTLAEKGRVRGIVPGLVERPMATVDLARRANLDTSLCKWLDELESRGEKPEVTVLFASVGLTARACRGMVKLLSREEAGLVDAGQHPRRRGTPVVIVDGNGRVVERHKSLAALERSRRLGRHALADRLGLIDPDSGAAILAVR